MSQDNSQSLGKSSSGADCENGDLLQAIAHCWPQDSDVVFEQLDSLCGRFMVERNKDTVFTRWETLANIAIGAQDWANGAAIVLMLDEMENRGYCVVTTSPTRAGDCYEASAYRMPWGKANIEMPTRVSIGPTRAWAIAACFVAVFGKGNSQSVASQQDLSQKGSLPQTEGLEK